MTENSPQPNQKIVLREIEDEMKESYLNYSMSVIVGRALPDVRDGLKPVHRRILFAMHDMGILHNKAFKKSARIVGEVLGKYHPHGDMAVYDAMVRMVQPFSLRYPLVQGQGNFGSVDGDSPAAMRYSEARLAKTAEDMLQDIDKETVPYVPNFDASLQEPTVLPSKMPNLLLNGSAGIAVGMATNIPPHNMNELADGIIHQIGNPEISLNELMQSIKGPDFPTGALICGRNGIVNAYSTGRGKLTVRAKMNVEEIKNHNTIVVTEIPYMVNKAETIEHIADLVRDKRIVGISDLRDESDRDGMRVLVQLKKDANPDVVINQLYKYSRLQVTFSVIMLALVNNVPKILPLKQVIHHFIEHRREMVRKRTQYDLKKAAEKAHILEGLIIALEKIGPVIQLIRKSKSAETAKADLVASFSLTEIQAQAILDMRLQRLTSLEQEKIRTEHKELLQKIEEYKDILAHEQKILDIIKKELLELKAQYGDARRTEIIDLETTELNMEDLVKDDTVVVTMTHSGYLKRLPVSTYKQQGRGGKGVIGAGTREGDFVEDVFIATTHSYILFFTNKGRVYWLKVYDIPEGSRAAQGKAIVNLLELQPDEKISAFIPVKEFKESNYLILATEKGTVKKTAMSAYGNPRKGGIIAITLDPNDALIEAVQTDGNQQLILATRNGMAVRFNEQDVRSTGRSAMGVRGITLRENDSVVAMVIASDDKTLLTVTENGYGKRSAVSEYRLVARASIGVKNIICSERNGRVVAVKCVSDQEDLILISQQGILIRVPASGISVIGRNTVGVTIMKLEASDKVVAAAKVAREEAPVEENESADSDQ
ncbi:DNA gyrase subunit A [Candidatus Woesearchaeota archaeon]|nr:DNA gyrase subunit A [Candidatus Woesearchaeota archaeon]